MTSAELLARRVRLRWSEWRPRAALHCARVHPLWNQSTVLARYEGVHRLRYHAAAATGLPPKSIALLRLDDPLADSRLLHDRLACAVERRQSRLGRVKGHSRHGRPVVHSSPEVSSC